MNGDREVGRSTAQAVNQWPTGLRARRRAAKTVYVSPRGSSEVPGPSLSVIEELRRLRCTPAYLYCLWICAHDPALRQALVRDAARELRQPTDRLQSQTRQRELLRRAAEHRTFRTVAYFRAPTKLAQTVARLLEVVLPGAPAIEIAPGPIDGGLAIRHGNGSVIRAQSIGKDCEIYQQVTVGAGRGGFPVIGDRVDLCAGSIVLGGIRIGDDVIIGAGAVVSQDVPDRALMLGNPARRVGSTDGQRAFGVAMLSLAEQESPEDR